MWHIILSCLRSIQFPRSPIRSPQSIGNNFRDTICSASHLHLLRSKRRLCNCFYFNCVVCENHRIDSISCSHGIYAAKSGLDAYGIACVATPYIQRKEKCANLIESTHNAIAMNENRRSPLLTTAELLAGWLAGCECACKSHCYSRRDNWIVHAFLGTRKWTRIAYYTMCWVVPRSRSEFYLVVDCFDFVRMMKMWAHFVYKILHSSLAPRHPPASAIHSLHTHRERRQIKSRKMCMHNS